MASKRRQHIHQPTRQPFGLSRRRFLGTAATAVGAAGLASMLPYGRRALAAQNLVAVEWGGPWVKGSKLVTAKQDKFDITWVLHEGGAAAILPKIKGSWPNTPYDLVDVWTPVFITMIREGWAETVTLDDVPNLADVPKSLITKDDKGNWKNVPRSISGVFFMYRPDICPIEITKLDDLLDPRLKGQICWPSPIMNTSLQTVALALHNGGDEFNIDPGWKMLEEIAKSGNIGRVYVTTTDTINSLSTGETSVTFTDQGTASAIANNVPVEFLTKVHESLKFFPFTEGWVVLKSSKNKKAAFEYANYTMTPANCELFNAEIGEAPTNSKSEPSPSVSHLSMSDAELEKYAYMADYEHVSKQVDAWVKRFESEIVPLL